MLRIRARKSERARVGAVCARFAGPRDDVRRHSFIGPLGQGPKAGGLSVTKLAFCSARHQPSLCWVRRRPWVCVCVWSGGVARWDDIPIRAVYNASQDDGYLELVVVPMMLRAGCGVSVCVACVRGYCRRLRS